MVNMVETDMGRVLEEEEPLNFVEKSASVISDYPQPSCDASLTNLFVLSVLLEHPFLHTIRCLDIFLLTN